MRVQFDEVGAGHGEDAASRITQFDHLRFAVLEDDVFHAIVFNALTRNKKWRSSGGTGQRVQTIASGMEFGDGVGQVEVRPGRIVQRLMLPPECHFAVHCRKKEPAASQATDLERCSVHGDARILSDEVLERGQDILRNRLRVPLGKGALHIMAIGMSDLRKNMIGAISLEIEAMGHGRELLAKADPELLLRAVQVLGGERGAARWLVKAHRSLGNRAPLELATTPEGMTKVLEVLGVIEHGVFT